MSVKVIQTMVRTDTQGKKRKARTTIHKCTTTEAAREWIRLWAPLGWFIIKTPKDEIVIQKS
jgi:hypothetical protein